VSLTYTHRTGAIAVSKTLGTSTKIVSVRPYRIRVTLRQDRCTVFAGSTLRYIVPEMHRQVRRVTYID